MASRLPPSLVHLTLKPTRAFTTILRPYPRLPRTLQPHNAPRRLQHTIPRPPNWGNSSSANGNGNGNGNGENNGSDDNDEKAWNEPYEYNGDEGKTRKELEPHYQLWFTCVPCGTRSDHKVSKQAYHHGSTLISCPECRNRHIISDHLGIFGDRKITVEDLMRERGRLVKRGTLGEDGDIEYWPEEPLPEGTEDPLAELDRQEDRRKAALKKSRKEKEAAAQSTSQVPLGTGGARPSIESTSDTDPLDPLPSTRREYSSTPSASANWDAFEMNSLSDTRGPEARDDTQPRDRKSQGIYADKEGHFLREGLLFSKVPVDTPANIMYDRRKAAMKYHAWNFERRSDDLDQEPESQLRPNEIHHVRSTSTGGASWLNRRPKDEALPYMLWLHRQPKKEPEPDRSGFAARAIDLDYQGHRPMYRPRAQLQTEEDILTQRLQLPRRTAYDTWLPSDDVRPSKRFIRPIPTRINSTVADEELIDQWPKLEGTGVPGRLPHAPPPPEIPLRSRTLANTLERAATAPWSRAVPKEDTTEAQAATEAEEKNTDATSSEDLGFPVRKIPQKPMSQPARALVPPWERREVFGPYGKDPTKHSDGRPKGGPKLDVWGDKSLSTDLRSLIEWGTKGRAAATKEEEEEEEI